MSAKWRALQHRHRYTYSSVIFPPPFVNALSSLSPTTLSLKFYTDMKQLISLKSIYSQVNHAKNVASSFAYLLTEHNEDLVSEASKFYLEILFVENSLPLHRTLLGVLSKTRYFRSVISDCFRKLCIEHGRLSGKGKRFCVSRVALSMMSSPRLGYLVDVVEECAVLVAWDIVLGLDGVVSETEEWSRPSPLIMEQCQEALSCLYYLLQRFPYKLTNQENMEHDLFQRKSNVLEMAMRVILRVLRSPAFSRDCFVAAGVSFCAALQVSLCPEELGLYIMEGIFDQKIRSFDLNGVISKVLCKGDLSLDVCSLSLLSRICLIRGILTAVPRTVLNSHFEISDNLNAFGSHEHKLGQTILYDRILPELCNYCENPMDSHFNFHALTVMQICLQQIKTSIQANLICKSGNYDPIPVEMGARILRIIWNNLEDPLSQTVKQVHLIFDLYLDILSTLNWGKGSAKIKTFLWNIASDLLSLGARCKGRYVPLASLTKRLGARTILDISSNLLFQTVQAYLDDDVCCAATSFLKCFLEQLRDECWSSDGVERGYLTFRGHSLPPFLCGLASRYPKLRSNLNTYALPVLLEVDVDSIFLMLASISVGKIGDDYELFCSELRCMDMALTVEQRVVVLPSLLKVSRLLALIEGDIDFYDDDSSTAQKAGGQEAKNSDHYALVCIKGIKVKIPVEWILLALTHLDESLRVDAAESLFLTPKTSSLPSHLELNLMKEAVPLNMRSCSTAFQMKWTSLFRKFFARVRTALERQIKFGSWKPPANDESCEVRQYVRTEKTVTARADNLFHFMIWLSCFLFHSCYPSASYERKIMAMELILIMLDVWSIVPTTEGNFLSDYSESCFNPHNRGITLPDSTLLLVGSIIDSWDQLRETSFRILLKFPAPLPGILSEEMVQDTIIWAKNLVCSPRVRESDAGALTLRLIFRKYVLELGWTVQASVNVLCISSSSETANGGNRICEYRFPVIEYIKSLIDWLHASIKEGEEDLSEACKNSIVHGILLTLRYAFEELDWNSDVVPSSTSEMKNILQKLLELVARVTSLALWVVSADAWCLPEDIEEMVDDDDFLIGGLDEKVAPVALPENEIKNLKFQDVRPSEQVVMVGCWLAMKEVSLLLGTIIRKIPLPPCTSPHSAEDEDLTFDADDAPTTRMTQAILDVKQLEAIGDQFLELLLKMKHNGAIDKTRAGFTALCNRLLCSNDPVLCRLTEYWMEQLMERTVAKGQVVDDLLRRSAGIPAAFLALFLSEPEGTPKRLLPRALRWLMDVANLWLVPSKVNDRNSDLPNNIAMGLCEETRTSLSSMMDANGITFKIRDEGVVPTVHAFNVLRVAFNDTNLATDTSGFSAEALIISIQSFSSPYWEVRNAACLAYTALVRRMIGYLNVQKRESSRRALTGLEFFHRYPSLHTFIFSELKVATGTLGDEHCEQSRSEFGSVVHPSLCPVLILLSRLKPSTISGETGDTLDPFLFMPFIRKCSVQRNLQIRALASRALTAIVSNEKLHSVLLTIASELPCLENQITATPASFISTGTTGPIYHASFNSLHGILLQLSSLLDANCGNLADFCKKDQIIGDLFEVLYGRSWIGNPRCCTCPILSASFLRMLNHMLGIARSCRSSENVGPVRSLLLGLSTKCLDLEASCKSSHYDPTKTELRKTAVKCYFNCIFQVSNEKTEDAYLIPEGFCSHVSSSIETPEKGDREDFFSGFQDKLECSLSDASYEVRLTTLKWFFQFLKSTECYEEADHSLATSAVSIVHLWAGTNLQATLMKLLDGEKHHKCRYYILRIFFTWNLQKLHKPSDEKNHIGEMKFESLFEFWDKLVFLYQLVRHTKTQEALICCMSICVKRFTDLFANSAISGALETGTPEINRPDHSERRALFYNCFSFFVSVIKQCSDSSQPVNMRKAAAEAVVVSGLLEQAEIIGPLVVSNQNLTGNQGSDFEAKEAIINKYGHAILDVWFACLKLLEDEDVGLRRRLSVDVQKLISFKLNRRCPQSGLIPTQVEKVIGLCFEYLSTIFSHWLDYFDFILQLVMDAANFTTSTRDLVRRLFDKEIDNHHEEKLFITQICCSRLEKISISQFRARDSCEELGVRKFLREWRMRFFHRLISFAEVHIRKREGFDWIGGVGNHKDAFLPLYGNLLGFYSLSKCILDGGDGDDSLLSDVVCVGKTIYPFFRNPLISNLYLSVVKLHEEMVGTSIYHLVSENNGVDTIWKGFNPYFILR